jgi:hypothetical protein
VLPVGDGSDEALSGARRCGQRLIVGRVDFSNTYVEAWDGPAIGALSELHHLTASL